MYKMSFLTEGEVVRNFGNKLAEGIATKIMLTIKVYVTNSAFATHG